MTKLDDAKAHEQELTKQIEQGRDALRRARKVDVPNGAGHKTLHHLVTKLTAWIGEKVKNRKSVRKRIRHLSDAGSGSSLKAGDLGVDVSQWNGSVNWVSVRQSGRKFAVAKATEGTGWTDPTWSKARVAAMQGAKLAVGAYHFARPDGSASDAQSEAQSFVAAVKGAGAKIISPADWGKKAGVACFLDFETSPYSSTWAKAFADEFHKQAGVKCGIYGGGYSLNPIVSALGAFAANWVWLAAYVSDWRSYFSGDDSDVNIWQFSSSGSVPGISGGCDVDRIV